MDSRFIMAFTSPGETRLLGYRMRPFSMKHRLALEAIKSPFVTPDKPVGIVDLFVAVKICAEQSIRSLSFLDMVRIMRIRMKPSLMEEYIKAFHSYTNMEQWPKFWTKSKQQSSSKGLPWMLSIVSNLMANGFDEEAAWSLPESQAIWYHTAFSVRNGNDITLLSDEDEDIMKNFNQIAAEAKTRQRVHKSNKA